MRLTCHQTAQGKAVGKGASSFKAQRETGRREGAGKRASWNTLFMRSDTIAQAAAALLGISAAELMNPEAEGALHLRLFPAFICVQTHRGTQEEGERERE
jgi:hypothetical protein